MKLMNIGNGSLNKNQNTNIQQVLQVRGSLCRILRHVKLRTIQTIPKNEKNYP
jgi:hypothetical protein